MKPRPVKPNALWGMDARSRRVVQPSAKPRQSVTETTFHAHQFTWLLRDLMQGNWRPTQGLLQRLGITVVYAVSESAAAEIRNSTRTHAPRKPVPIEMGQTGQSLEGVI